MMDRPPQDILIVGSGVFGLSTAWALTTRPFFDNTKISVIDDARGHFPPADAASHDSSRIIRADYADADYAELATEAQGEWRKTGDGDLGGQGRYSESGLLLVASQASSPGRKTAWEYCRASYGNVSRIGGGAVRELPTQTAVQEFLGTEGGIGDWGYVNAASGWADAARGMAWLLERVRGTGRVTFVDARVEELVTQGDSVVGVRTRESTLKAEVVLVAAGAWTGSLVDLRGVVEATGQPMGYVDITEEERRVASALPIVLDFSSGLFIVPPRERVLKVARHTYGYTNPVTVTTALPRSPAESRGPIVVSRPTTARLPGDSERALRRALRELTPLRGLEGRAWRQTRLCWYADTCDGDWLVDWHPGWKGLFVATGDSGHAFKFLPILGDKVADCLMEFNNTSNLEERIILLANLHRVQGHGLIAPNHYKTMSSRFEFPGVEAKLQKPTKQSAFEKQKAEAEAKRQREAAETAAVYEDFVKSFENGRDDAGRFARDSFAQSRPSGGPAAGSAPKRHFGTSGLKSGPGSLGPSTGFAKKRTFGEREGGSNVTMAFDASDDEDMGDAIDRAQEKAIARPTLRLSNLPPGTSPAMIRTLLPDNLVVENIKIQPPSGTGSERKYTVAIVTLSMETPANEMDAAVSLLQNRYVGCGCYLSLHRHLSSAVSTSTLPSLGSSLSSSSHPFGARPVEQGGRSDKPQHGFHRAYAPPSTYGGGGGVSRSDLLCVQVKPPQDIRTVQLINKVIEGVLEHGMEFEALLMSRPEVQREEKWAWLWDARSQGGVWYRWTLWEVVTGAQGAKRGKYVPLFEDSHAWKTPEKRLPYEFATKLDQFVSDSEYNSSDDEDLEGEAGREGQNGEEEKTFLNPLEKAKLVHLLARLPTALSRVRKGDIARVTAFAITHVSRGVDEIVDLIISNVVRPLSRTAANPMKKEVTGDGAEEAGDASAASLVGLYAVSDILSSSSTSTVRHAWRYRQLFETALREHKVFEHLGCLAEKHGWGRLRAEKWKRSVNLVLDLWEGWCVFPAESQGFFTSTFESSPLLRAKGRADESAKRGRWKLVEEGPGEPLEEEEEEEEEDVDGEPIEEEDVAGEPIGEEDVEGEPIEEDDVEGEPMEEDELSVASDKEARGARKRMRAVDMFADSDHSEG